MKVGGTWRGLSRAASHAFAFSKAHAVAGIVLIVISGVVFGPSEYGDLTGIFLVAHLGSVIALWPGAVLVNLILLRLFRPRSWRHAPWRAWVAGIAALPLIWAGLIVSSRFDEDMGMVRRVFGSCAPYVTLAGRVIGCGNLAIALGWALPPWGNRRT